MLSALLPGDLATITAMIIQVMAVVTMVRHLIRQKTQPQWRLPDLIESANDALMFTRTLRIP